MLRLVKDKAIELITLEITPEELLEDVETGPSLGLAGLGVKGVRV